MKAILLVLGLTLATTYSSIIQIKPERKLADADFLKRQKQVLDLYVGLGHDGHFHKEVTEFDFTANIDKFINGAEVVKEFLDAYKHGFLPVDGIFTLNCHHTRKDTIRMFNLFYFAKDFDTFYRIASWARNHVNPLQFSYVYTLALIHRDDCKYYALPPLYEVFPNYFAPVDTMHDVYDTKMSGIKERKFIYNNTGYEYNYHSYMFGGPLNVDAVGHLDYKISYLREDVGANSWYSMTHLRFPSWMKPEKYRGTHWFRRGETLYYRYQQVFARYLLERIANGLPYVERLYWEEPIRVGYNPRVAHLNGEHLYTRPDNVVPKELNRARVIKAKLLERRLLDAVDSGALWEISNQTLLSLRGEEGTDLLGRLIFGVADRPSKKYFGNYFWEALEALGLLVHTSNDHDYLGGALSFPTTTLRDPLFYQFLNRLIGLFQHHKKFLPHYTHEQLEFGGVRVNDFVVDKFTTYFDNYEYDVTNGVPVEQPDDYNTYRYYAQQYRLNHKPYTYKVTVTSDAPKEALVRVYLGPKYDSEERELNLEQSRMAFFEIDRFPVKLSAGENVFERNSRESTIFVPDPEGFRSIYSRINNALKGTEQYYYTQRHSCGLPNRYQLPRGSSNGHPFRVAVVITPLDQVHTGDEKDFYAPCGGPRLYDSKPFGFPFDRPLDTVDLHHVPNFFFKDVQIYHKEHSDLNRSQQ